MKKGDVEMAKLFSKKYGNKGRAFNYMQTNNYVKILDSIWCYIPTSLPPEPSSIFYYLKLNSGVWTLKGLSKGIWYFFLQHAFPGFSSFMGDNNTKYLGPYHWSRISFSCLFLTQWCRDIASGTDKHLDITFGLQVVESSSFVSVLFS